MPSVTIVKLVGPWEVQVIPVPPHASYRWGHTHISSQLPDRPGPPMAEIESVAGHTETVAALPGSEEYEAWRAAEAAWQEAYRRLTEEVAEHQMAFSMDYAIQAWRPKDSDEDWRSDPPEDWEPNEALHAHGVELIDDPRVQYIMLELLEHPADYDIVRLAAYPGGELDMSPVTDEEVGAAMASFRSGDENAGFPRVGGHPQTGVGRRANVSIRRGDADSRRKASIPRRVVFLFTGR